MLVVDNHGRCALVQQLQLEGHDALKAANGDDALARLFVHGTIDLLIT